MYDISENFSMTSLIATLILILSHQSAVKNNAVVIGPVTFKGNVKGVKLPLSTGREEV